MRSLQFFLKNVTNLRSPVLLEIITGLVESSVLCVYKLLSEAVLIFNLSSTKIKSPEVFTIIATIIHYMKL